jgi:type IV pilus assembly protein PilY1
MRCLFGDSSTPARGFFFYAFRYHDSSNNVRTGRIALFSGGWLNANPPKFMSARKVVKDTVWIDPARPSNSDLARFGLSYYTTALTDRAAIVVPLGPSRANTYPTNWTRMVEARQLILDAVNHSWPGGVTLPALANGATPTASALFRLGQYYSSPNYYTSRFGSSYEIAAFRESTTGLMRASWAGSADQKSICWGCQENAIILVTDGSPNTEITLPATLRSYDQGGYQLTGNCGPAQTTRCNGSPNSLCCSPSQTLSDPPSYAPRVASWLHASTTDLRDDLSLNNPQNVTVSTVSFNLPPGNARTILQATANMGGGSYNNAADGRDLANAVSDAVQQITNRANSFSAPAASSLSTIHTVSSEVFVTRFKPNDTPAWEGHVFQGNLFDEFLAGCDPTKTPDQQPQVRCGTRVVSANFNGDTDAAGFSICTGVFMVDQDCAEIIEDPRTGDFLKKGSGGVAANLIWDAGRVLSDPTRPGYRTAQEGRANSRKILTAVPSGAGYATIPFDTDPANLARFQPFMNLTPDWCLNILRLARLCGTATTPACPTLAGWTAAATTQCAEQVVHYVRGWDVLDNDGDTQCFGPGNPNNLASCPSGTLGEQRDRANDSRTSAPTFWKLGDIFHSSPVLAKPPVVEPVCDTGYDNQCVTTIHSPQFFSDQTAIDTYTACKPNSDAYEAWRYDRRDRRRILLIGANDGMLHAFDAGSADASKSRDSDCNLPYTTGTGEERWAFVPPDMLPRLKDMLLGHQYTVDGNTMVRDVWVDANGDRRKQRDEFHTLAISTERAGGTQVNALDVTDTENPVFLWTFPPPCSEDARWMGQSWSDFAPRPPPVGPVKIALPSGSTDALGRNFEERWIAMINGGYDPAMGAGRAVWMVDVWTGRALWRFTDDDFKAMHGRGSGVSMFPVPAAVGLVDLGDTSRPRYDADGYFDTATWGDMGGNLFVARFQEPGVVDATTGRVGNWHAARTFETQRRADDMQFAAGRSPIFFMTANTYDPQGKALHTYAGTGNRERIMQQGEVCGPDNLIGCCRAGCTAVDASTVDGYGACGFQNRFTCNNGQYFFAASDTCSGSATCGASGSFTSNVTLQFTCPGVGTVTPVTSGITCAADGTCSAVAGIGSATVYERTSTCPTNRFYGVLSYGRYPEKLFTTASEAAAFDRNRYTDVTFTQAGTCGSTAGNCTLVDTTTAQTRVDRPYATCGGGVTRCQATADDPGWFYQYGSTCPVVTCPTGGCSNEKTGSSAGISFGCTLWNGFQPVGAQTGSDPCTGNAGTPVVYGYASDYIAGVPSGNCGYNTYPETVLYRAQQRGTVAPPSGGIFRVSVSAKGEVAYSSLQMDPGAAPSSTQTGTRSDIAEPVYWLEVGRQLHDCRHDPTRTAGACE